MVDEAWRTRSAPAQSRIHPRDAGSCKLQALDEDPTMSLATRPLARGRGTQVHHEDRS